jgi:hypothetical protein
VDLGGQQGFAGQRKAERRRHLMAQTTEVRQVIEWLARWTGNDQSDVRQVA